MAAPQRRAQNPHKSFDPQSVLERISAFERDDDMAMDNQRQWRRFSVRGEVDLLPMDPAPGAGVGGETVTDAEPIRVQLRDIGRTGVGLLSSKPLEVGDIFYATFLMRGYRLWQVPLAVRHCQTIASNVYLVGMQVCFEPAVLWLLGVPENDLNGAGGAMPITNADAYAAPDELD